MSQWAAPEWATAILDACAHPQFLDFVAEYGDKAESPCMYLRVGSEVYCVNRSYGRWDVGKYDKRRLSWLTALGKPLIVVRELEVTA